MTYLATPTLESLQSLTRDTMANVNQVIVDSANQHVPLITDIAQHIVKAGGKRLRPTLTIACAQLLGYSNGTRHVQLAAAVELIHTATLLHDDVVDESTMRRGYDTANAVWSNQASVLVGDYLLSRAFQLMVADGSLDVLKILSDASATISQGEVLQLSAAGDLSTNKALYLKIIHAKTAALFSAACEVSAFVAGKPEQQPHLQQFGTQLGIAFQLVDDALDYAASEATLGKAIGDDLRESKMTLPVIIAYEHATTAEQHFWQRVIGEQNIRTGDLEEATQLIEKYHGIEQTLHLAKNYSTSAAQALHAINGNRPTTEALHDCIAFCVSRDV
jgi:octaprenyl-diphosphate synthase